MTAHLTPDALQAIRADRDLNAMNAHRVRAAHGKYGDLAAAVVDLCWRAVPFGQDADGWVDKYLLTTGTVHRLIGAAQGAGIPATFRNGATADQDASREQDLPAVVDAQAAVIEKVREAMANADYHPMQRTVLVTDLLAIVGETPTTPRTTGDNDGTDPEGEAGA